MQAGASPRGRDFAARHADAVFAPPIGGLEGMKAIRDDIKARAVKFGRSEEHTSELQSLMRISYAVLCLKKKNKYARKPYYKYKLHLESLTYTTHHITNIYLSTIRTTIHD